MGTRETVSYFLKHHHKINNRLRKVLMLKKTKDLYYQKVI